jgi:membrane protease YdiL (CAAX protease family)
MGVAWSGILPYALGLALVGALVRTRRLRQREPGPALRQRLGIVLLTAPVFTLVGVGLASLPSLAGSTARVAASPDLLASKALLHLSLYLAVPLAGLILVLGGSFWTRAREALAPSREALVGGLRSCVALSSALAGFLGFTWALSGGDGGLLAVDGASLFFSRTTPGVALALSLIAAVAEELCFRGVLLDALDARISTKLAVVLQAVAFGLIHAGYGSLLHVLAATTFGLIVGVLALRAGLIPAIGTHVTVNLVILSLWSGHAILLVPAGLLLAGMLGGARLIEAGHLPRLIPQAVAGGQA